MLGQGGEALFAAGVADMDFKAPPAVIDALQARLDHGVFGYETVPEGLVPALSEWLQRRHGWQVEMEHVLRAPNILNALAIAATLFTKDGDGVIVQPPVFFDFFDILRENHRDAIANPLILKEGRYVMDFEDLERKASAPRAKMIFLCNPHNPVGKVWSEQELRTLGDICARHGVVVVADEMHGDLAFPGHKYTPFASLGPGHAANSITCLSPAKTFNIASCCSSFTVVPGRRQAQGFSRSRTAASRSTRTTPLPTRPWRRPFATGSPGSKRCSTTFRENVDLVRSRLKEMPTVELIEPDGTFLLWMDFRKLGMEPDALTAFLRHKAGWAVTRGQAFGKEGAGFARLNLGCTRAKLEAALTRLANALA